MANFVKYPSTGNAAGPRVRATAMWDAAPTPDAGRTTRNLSSIGHDVTVAALATQGAPPRGEPR